MNLGCRCLEAIADCNKIANTDYKRAVSADHSSLFYLGITHLSAKGR
jgi:hypothetical protein